MSIFISVFFVIVSEPVFARKAYMKVGKATNMPSVGIKMKVPKGVNAKPLGSLSFKTLTQTRGSETRKIECFFPEDLWVRDQLVGRYGSDKLMLSVYEMSLPPAEVPAVFQQAGHSYVLKEAYDKWKEEQKGVEWDDEKKMSWVKYLLRTDIKTDLEKMRKGGAKKANTSSLNVRDSDKSNFIYFISPLKTPDKNYVLQFSLSSSLDIKKSKKGIAQCLNSMVFYTPKKTKTDAKKMTVGKKSMSKKKEWSPEYLASRERVIKNIKNLKDWWYLETDNFIIVANIKNKKTIRELHGGLEKSRNVFTKIYPIKQPLTAVSVVKSFETRQGYQDYVAGKIDMNTAGLWMSDRKELVVSPMNWGSVRDRRKMMVEVIQHEGFHQYIYFATGGQHTAVWYNEGNACFFSGIKFKGKRPVIEGTYRLEIAKKLAPAADIQSLINMSQAEYYSNPKINYPLGYGLMFFLHKGAPIMKKKNTYSDIPTKYYNAVLETKNTKKATEIAWEGVDMDEFTREFRKFWASKTLIKKALRYDLIKAKALEFAKK